MSVYQLTPREVYETYIDDRTDPAEVLRTERDALATRLRSEDGLNEEEAYHATDQIMAYAQELQNQPQGEERNG